MKMKSYLANHSLAFSSVSIRSARSAGAHLAFPLPFWFYSSTMKHWSRVSMAIE